MSLYDEKDPSSIEAYGKGMIGKTFREIYTHAVSQDILYEDKAEYAESHASKNYKGGVGNLVEECWFGYKANSDAEADFPEAGVELKVTPYQQVKKTIKKDLADIVAQIMAYAGR